MTVMDRKMKQLHLLTLTSGSLHKSNGHLNVWRDLDNRGKGVGVFTGVPEPPPYHRLYIWRHFLTLYSNKNTKVLLFIIIQYLFFIPYYMLDYMPGHVQTKT